MTIHCGITPVLSSDCGVPVGELIAIAEQWGRRENVLESGARMVVVDSPRWTERGHDLLLVHVVD